MRARFALLVVAGVLGCGGGSSGGDAAVDSRDARKDTGATDTPADVPSGMDQRTDQAPSDVPVADAPADVVTPDVATDVPTDTGSPVDSGGSCVTQTILGPRGGTTSSCSFKVSTSIPHDLVNVLIGGGRLCEQGSNNCSSKGGWFWFGDDEIALCDATCLVWENSRNNLVVEVGCASQSCSACNQGGGACGDGINQCCAGWRCTGGTCATCGRGGQTCTTTADCCTGGTCTGGVCVNPMGGTCVSQAGCSQGVCRDGFCQCPADQLWCNSGCVNYLDPNNCRGCGNVCATGTGRVCTVDGCVCDPQSALPDECQGTCVNKKTDRTNCGACFNTCGRLEQVCNNGVCGCPAGQTECNGGCVDTSSSQTSCGICNRGCPVGTEVCSAGTCVCAPGYTRCPTGNCVNLKTDRNNCNACGTACPGNKTCTNGTCG